MWKGTGAYSMAFANTPEEQLEAFRLALEALLVERGVDFAAKGGLFHMLSRADMAGVPKEDLIPLFVVFLVPDSDEGGKE